MIRNIFFNICFVFSLSLHPFFSFGQTQQINNLKTSFYKTVNAQQKFTALIALCDEGGSMNIDTLYHYALVAKQIAYRSDYRTNIILADVAMENWLIRKDHLNAVLKLCDTDLKSINYTTAGDLFTKVNMQKCYTLVKSNMDKEAMDELYHFLNEAEIKEDTVSQIFCKTMIAFVYRDMQQTYQALQWAFKAANTGIDKSYDEQKNSFGVYFLIGMMYNWMASADTNENDISRDSLLSVNFLNKEISLSRQYENLPILARSLCIQASAIDDRKKLNLTKKYLDEAINIYSTLGDTLSIISSITVMCDYYMDIDEPQNGVKACLNAIDMANRGHAFPLPDLYSKLGECYKAAGDHIKYEETLNKIIQINDETYKKNSAKDLAYLNAKYEDQKKENTIIQQQYALTKKNYLFFWALLLFAMLMIASYVFFQNRKKDQQLKIQQVIFEQKENTAAAVLQAGENERKRIAGDLHDSVAQKMIAAKLNLAAFEDELPLLNDEQQRVYNNIVSLVDDSCLEVRSLSQSMMPQAFFRAGLVEAVKDFIDKIDNKKLQASFNAEGKFDNLAKDKAIIIYRIIQESIQNVLKHAKASKLDVAMIADNDEIDVTIEDNGIGFDPKQLAESESLGMKNIQSRIDFLNGKIDIDSQSGRGTIIAFFIPVI